MTSIELRAPAKVNIFLKVLGKRKDSYHAILTLFERISLADTVRISKTARGITVVSDLPITARPEDNIAYKAARLILSHRKAQGKALDGRGVRISIRKRIPLAAGLGGGSSDAAAVLIGINKLFNIRINKAGLLRLGAQLGADVPFFLLETPFAAGTGRGDRLKKVRCRVNPWHLLVYPGPFKASTREIYRQFDSQAKCLTRILGSATIKPFDIPGDMKGLEGLLHNDLGDIAAKAQPAIGRTIQCLVSSLGKRTIVAGSGPSVFCLYRTRGEAIAARARLFRSVPAAARKSWRVFIVGTEA